VAGLNVTLALGGIAAAQQNAARQTAEAVARQVAGAWARRCASFNPNAAPGLTFAQPFVQYAPALPAAPVSGRQALPFLAAPVQGGLAQGGFVAAPVRQLSHLQNNVAGLEERFAALEREVRQLRYDNENLKALSARLSVGVLSARCSTCQTWVLTPEQAWHVRTEAEGLHLGSMPPGADS